MNGRLYDPLLGRFLSPDNYVQLPDFSQSFNRYSYCLNNPLKYTDPSGEAFGIDDAILIGVVISGLANVGVNWDEINSFGHGVVSFFTGAVSGGLSISGNPVLGALVAGAGNSIINQGFNNGWNNISVDAVFASTGMSLLTYGVGSKIGTKFDKITSKITNGIKNKILKEGIHDAISGALGGFTIGTGFSLFNGNNIGDALGDGAKYATQGAIINGLNGVNRGYNSSKGKTLSPHQKGKLGVQRAEREFIKGGGTITGHEVTIEVDGIRVRPDLIGEKDGMLYIIEVKNGPKAGPTYNQKIVYPKLESGKTPFIPQGRNAMNVPQFQDILPSGSSYTGNYKFLMIKYK